MRCLARDRRGDGVRAFRKPRGTVRGLLSGRGEASGVALAREILGSLPELTIGPRIAFFEALAQRFGTDPARMEQAIAAWRAGAVAMRPLPKSMPHPSRAGRNCSAGSISRRVAPPPSCACASS